MATIQDIRALELRIYEAVEEYLDAPDAYTNPVLHVYLDSDERIHRAEIAENLPVSDDDGVYAIESVVRDGDEGREPDVDSISDIANSWVFLDWADNRKSIKDQKRYAETTDTTGNTTMRRWALVCLWTLHGVAFFEETWPRLLNIEISPRLILTKTSTSRFLLVDIDKDRQNGFLEEIHKGIIVYIILGLQ